MLIRMKEYQEWKIIQGIVFIGWVLVEFFLIQEANTLKISYLILGGAILLGGIILGRSSSDERGNN